MESSQRYLHSNFHVEIRQSTFVDNTMEFHFLIHQSSVISYKPLCETCNVEIDWLLLSYKTYLVHIHYIIWHDNQPVVLKI